MTDLTNKKTIYWIRHAESISNISENNSNMIDPKITIEGYNQCVKLKEIIYGKKIIQNINLVIVSPLERTLETCVKILNHDNIISKEEIREFIDKPCHQRLCISKKKNEYKNINFSQIEYNCDNIYTETNGKESDYHLIIRIEKFLNWLSNIREKNIIVISHGTFLFTLFNKVLINNPTSISNIKFYTKLNIDDKNYINSFFNNCEMKKCDIYFN